VHTAKDAGAGRDGGLILARGDPAFYTHAVVAAARRSGTCFSMTARQNRSVQARSLPSAITRGLQLLHAPTHRGRAHRGRLGDNADPAMTQQPRFGRQRQPLLTLVQMRQQHRKPGGQLQASVGIDAHTTLSNGEDKKTSLERPANDVADGAGVS